MANPYHDEAGRFTSKAEMGAAVDRLHHAISLASSTAELNEATEAWFNLRTEYEALSSQELAAANAGKFDPAWLERRPDFGGEQIDTMLAGKLTIREDAELRDMREQLLNHNYLGDRKASGVHHSGESALALYRSDRARGYSAIVHLDAGEKVKLLTELSREGALVSGDVAQAALKSESGSDENVVKAVLSTSELAPGLKLNLAKRNNLLPYYATRNPRLFADDPALESQLLDELAIKTEDHWDEELEASWSSVASHAKSESARNEVLGRFSHEDYSPAIIGQMAKNPNLDGSDRLVIFTTVVENDAASWSVIASRMASAAEADSAERQELVGALERYSQMVANEDTGDYKPLDHHGVTAANEALSFYDHNAEHLTDAEVRDRVNHHALLDAQPEAYDQMRTKLAETRAAGGPTTGAPIARRVEAATRLRAAHIATQEYEDGHYTR